jgi:hypothetical protein
MTDQYVTAGELLDFLVNYPRETQVRIYADHGQHSMMASTVCACYLPKSDAEFFMTDVVYDEPGEDRVLCIEIGAP